MATKVDVSHNFWRARAIRRVTKERRREKERRVGEERRRGEGGEKERKRGGGKGFIVELEENPGAAARAKVPPVPVRKAAPAECALKIELKKVEGVNALQKIQSRAPNMLAGPDGGRNWVLALRDSRHTPPGKSLLVSQLVFQVHFEPLHHSSWYVGKVCTSYHCEHAHIHLKAT